MSTLVEKKLKTKKLSPQPRVIKHMRKVSFMEGKTPDKQNPQSKTGVKGQTDEEYRHLRACEEKLTKYQPQIIPQILPKKAML